MLTTIDERLRRRPDQLKKEPSPKTANIQTIKYSQTYLDLHKRIGTALIENKEEKFQMELPERKKDPIVYLSEKSDWSQHASTFRGDSSFRDTFDSAISGTVFGRRFKIRILIRILVKKSTFLAKTTKDIYEDILTQHQKHLN